MKRYPVVIEPTSTSASTARKASTVDAFSGLRIWMELIGMPAISIRGALRLTGGVPDCSTTSSMTNVRLMRFTATGPEPASGDALETVRMRGGSARAMTAARRRR